MRDLPTICRDTSTSVQKIISPNEAECLKLCPPGHSNPRYYIDYPLYSLDVLVNNVITTTGLLAISVLYSRNKELFRPVWTRIHSFHSCSVDAADRTTPLNFVQSSTLLVSRTTSTPSLQPASHISTSQVKSPPPS